MLRQCAIKTEKLRKDYPGQVAVQDLDLDIPTGVIHGFLGPNGAGKSTTLRMVCGLLRPSGGKVMVEGLDPVADPAGVKRLVGLLPENNPLYREMVVEDFLTFSARLHGVAKEHRSRAVSRVTEQVGLGEVRGRLIGNLSKGYRQRVGIAQALVHDPRILILDEPTAGLDPQSVVEVRALIRSLRGEKTVVFSGHILHEVEAVCDTVSIIDRGVLKASGPLDQVLRAFEGRPTLRVEVGAAPDLHSVRALPYVESVTLEEETGARVLVIQQRGREEVRGELVRALVAMGAEVRGLETRVRSLEDVFIAVTKGAP